MHTYTSCAQGYRVDLKSRHFNLKPVTSPSRTSSELNFPSNGLLPIIYSVGQVKPVTDNTSCAKLVLKANGKEMSTTMTFVRMMGIRQFDSSLNGHS